MFAVQFDEFGSPAVLGIGTRAEPHPGPGQVRIKVAAAGVSPVDLAVRAGSSPSRDQLVLPHIPGVDAAGVIDEVGAGVDGFSAGNEVFGAVDIGALGGACAQFAVLAFWAAKPGAMSWAEAGTAGTSIETATRALEALGVGEGTTVLIDGAAGGVGSIAVQLASARGARVIGTGRPASHAFLASLGAIPVTYGPGLAQRVRDLAHADLALDVAGAGSLDDLVEITGDAAKVITLADFTGPARGVRLSLGRYGGEPDGRHGLAAAAALSANGHFRVPVREIFPAARAAEAHAAAARGPQRGKVVIELAAVLAD